MARRNDFINERDDGFSDDSPLIRRRAESAPKDLIEIPEREFGDEPTDTVREYLRGIGQHALLTAPEELALGLDVERWMFLKEIRARSRRRPRARAQHQRDCERTTPQGSSRTSTCCGRSLHRPPWSCPSNRPRVFCSRMTVSDLCWTTRSKMLSKMVSRRSSPTRPEQI